MSNFTDWLKDNRVAIAFWLGLIVIVSLSFGLGYLLGHQNNPASIIIEKNSK